MSNKTNIMNIGSQLYIIIANSVLINTHLALENVCAPGHLKPTDQPETNKTECVSYWNQFRV